ncbi:hypothetical protein K461DRAFT_289202 [Myriangium duriaei CBS 260.36]|uniref:Uncharacterized protein n=1 Tax=Myriangium duriaei CBS 260.36 TaxID=1168546 RepID=A0A9P4JDG2_9PEZI|nr:hypothetical protein K461DRAFT_289202 [Myriangium duriaei CBS 260.36]
MFATRHNQENVTHLHQTTAATKPLNQALSKTPGPKANAPKTPFRNRNDENASHTVLKTGAGKVKANLFATPAPGKPRAVLGAKTTNAKAVQTPGQGAKTGQKPAAPPSTQKVSPRLKRSKVRIHQPSPSATVDEADDSAPEVEYCPPPRILTPPLPNHPDDLHELPLEDLFSQERFLRNIFANPVPSQASDRLDRAREARIESMNRSAAAALELENMTFTDPELEALRQETVKPTAQRPAPATLSSRSAAAALARPTPSFAAPTAAAKQRARDTQSHHAAAAAASRTTVGYARGRQVSGAKRAPLSSAHRAGVVRAPKEGVGRKNVREVVMPSAEEDGEEEEVRDEEFDRLVGEDFVLEF